MSGARSSPSATAAVYNYYISDLAHSISLFLFLVSPSHHDYRRYTWPFVVPACAFCPRIDDAHRSTRPLCHVKRIRCILRRLALSLFSSFFSLIAKSSLMVSHSRLILRGNVLRNLLRRHLPRLGGRSRAFRKSVSTISIVIIVVSYFIANSISLLQIITQKGNSMRATDSSPAELYVHRNRLYAARFSDRPRLITKIYPRFN